LAFIYPITEFNYPIGDPTKENEHSECELQTNNSLNFFPQSHQIQNTILNVYLMITIVGILNYWE